MRAAEAGTDGLIVADATQDVRKDERHMRQQKSNKNKETLFKYARTVCV